MRVIEIAGRPYLERYFMGRVLGVTVYLHRFVSGDGERHLHDHPWRWAGALVLAGGYAEARLRWLCPRSGPVCREARRVAPAVNVLGPRAMHRIVSVLPGTWTLFVHGRRCKGWGFLRPTDRDLVLYYQPLEVESSQGWETRARCREAA